ncbi:ATP-dependent zinc metalloprotease FtsH [Lacrimispora sp. BS-2]|uniref:ATP-dependent zinc metalloprotease FtsH n=1 Tax=Lacrimispora sp. BS-2 TaxID=3151850 RepID=A0AAU7PQ39_9FIRM
MGLKDDGSSQNNQKKPFIFYYVIVLLIMILFNALTVPWIQSKSVTEVPYSTFLEMVDQGKVQAVAKTETEIQFKSDTGKKDWEGKPVYDVYKTGLWPDDTLTERLIAHDVSFEKTIVVQMSPLLSFLLTWIIPILIFVFLGNFLSGQLQKKMGGGNAMTFGKSNPKIYAESETGKTFRDVAGQEEAKEALKEIVDFLHNPQKYADIGASLPKGALLVGPPGTGKTLLARAVAGEAHVPFFSISGSEFVEMFVGMGAAKVRDLFKQAGDKAPCIVFIDEIDTIGKKRDGGGFTGNDEREQTLNQLLAEMDGFDGKKGVVILAATNRPDSLDKALLRPGRFDRRIPVELPDLNGREAILKVHGKNVKLSDDVDFHGVALATAGSSGAELANIVNEAALRAVRMGRKTVTQRDLEESVEVVIAGYQKKDASVNARERKIIAYHEVGHALVAACQNHSAPVHKITIIPRTSGALGYTMQVDEEERHLLTKEAALSKIATFTGGRAAEELVFDTVTSGASNDIEQATRIARAMVTRYGMTDEFDMVALETVTNQYLGGDTALACSPETARQIDNAVIRIVKDQHQKALKILKDNETKLHEIAEYLLERETITGEEFMKIAGFDSAGTQES